MQGSGAVASILRRERSRIFDTLRAPNSGKPVGAVRYGCELAGNRWQRVDGVRPKARHLARHLDPRSTSMMRFPEVSGLWPDTAVVRPSFLIQFIFVIALTFSGKGPNSDYSLKGGLEKCFHLVISGRPVRSRSGHRRRTAQSDNLKKRTARLLCGARRFEVEWNGACVAMDRCGLQPSPQNAPL